MGIWLDPGRVLENGGLADKCNGTVKEESQSQHKTKAYGEYFFHQFYENPCISLKNGATAGKEKIFGKSYHALAINGKRLRKTLLILQ